MLEETEITTTDERCPVEAVAEIIGRKWVSLIIRDLAKAGQTVFVTTHYMEEAEYCHRLALMYKGRTIALGTPARLKAEHGEGASMNDVFIASIEREEAALRALALNPRFPQAPIMLGIGNLTELTDADTTGINAVLFGIIAELKLNAVLTTSVSPHACNAVAEADVARRVMHAADTDRRLPRDYSNGLLGLHDRRPFTYTGTEIAELAAQVKDPSFRIQVSEKGVHVYNRDGLFRDIDPFRLYPHLKVDDDASHAFYLGVELARAQIAWQLGKRYRQDEELQWGCNTTQEDARGRVAHREASIKEKREKGSK